MYDRVNKIHFYHAEELAPLFDQLFVETFNRGRMKCVNDNPM